MINYTQNLFPVFLWLRQRTGAWNVRFVFYWRSILNISTVKPHIEKHTSKYFHRFSVSYCLNERQIFTVTSIAITFDISTHIPKLKTINVTNPNREKDGCLTKRQYCISCISTRAIKPKIPPDAPACRKIARLIKIMILTLIELIQQLK